MALALASGSSINLSPWLPALGLPPCKPRTDPKMSLGPSPPQATPNRCPWRLNGVFSGFGASSLFVFVWPGPLGSCNAGVVLGSGGFALKSIMPSNCPLSKGPSHTAKMQFKKEKASKLGWPGPLGSCKMQIKEGSASVFGWPGPLGSCKVRLNYPRGGDFLA